jgi:hypothetical protein
MAELAQKVEDKGEIGSNQLSKGIGFIHVGKVGRRNLTRSLLVLVNMN